MKTALVLSLRRNVLTAICLAAFLQAGQAQVIFDQWADIAPALTNRGAHTAVWTGTELIVWGGLGDGGAYLNSGARYNPKNNTWTAISTNNAPAGREGHTAVWTGTNMIIWGGWDSPNSNVNTGGRYNPATDSWTATDTSTAPTARRNVMAVWTGKEMIVWGGFDGAFTNTGGRYDPAIDRWTPTALRNAPSARHVFGFVWTGFEAVVWGGFDGAHNYLDTGGRYDPACDRWTPTSLNAAPSARRSHSATWIGDRMIVFGGANNAFPSPPNLDTGASYTLKAQPVGDVNSDLRVTGADSLLINQVLVGLRSFVVSQIIPNFGTTNAPTAVRILGIGFPTDGVTGVTIGPPVNLTLSNVVQISREEIIAIVPAGGGTGTGLVTVAATPDHGAVSFARFIRHAE
jgi:hypothetical protein